MTRFRSVATLGLIAPLALGLAACDSADETASIAGEPVEAVAAPEGTSWSETVSVTDKGGYLVGNPDAPISLVEYGSLTCPACAAFSIQGSEKLHKEYIDSGRVKFEFRSFVIHGALDLVLTRMLDCGAPEAAVPMADQIWSNLPQIQQRAFADQGALEGAMSLPEDQRFVAFAQAADLYDFFAARGLSRDQAASCLADFKSMQDLAAYSQSYSQDDGINKTPTFVINGQQIDESAWADVEAALQRAGAR